MSLYHPPSFPALSISINTNKPLLPLTGVNIIVMCAPSVLRCSSGGDFASLGVNSAPRPAMRLPISSSNASAGDASLSLYLSPAISGGRYMAPALGCLHPQDRRWWTHAGGAALTAFAARRWRPHLYTAPRRMFTQQLPLLRTHFIIFFRQRASAKRLNRRVRCWIACSTDKLW